MPEDVSEYMPQYASDGRRARRAGAAWVAALSVAALLVGVIVAAPLLRARGAYFVSEAIYRGFHAACHQMPERSFHLWGFPLAVCARCFGLYAGALAGLLVYPLARGLTRTDAPPRAWLLLAALPTSVDFALGMLGLWENTHWSRFLTALLLGGASAFYVMPGAADLALRYWPRRGGALVAVRPSHGS
jgi:uncharacterized membrane protein